MTAAFQDRTVAGLRALWKRTQSIAHDLTEVKNLLRPIVAHLWEPPAAMINEVAVMFFENRLMSAPDATLVESLLKQKYSQQIQVLETCGRALAIVTSSQDELHLRRAVKEANTKICANRNETKRQSKELWKKLKNISSEAERRELIDRQRKIIWSTDQAQASNGAQRAWLYS